MFGAMIARREAVSGELTGWADVSGGVKPRNSDVSAHRVGDIDQARTARPARPRNLFQAL